MAFDIPFVALHTAEKEALYSAIFSEIKQAVVSSQFILGEPVTTFEKRFATLTHCLYAVGVNSGLDALLLTLRALNIGPGDEVITPPNSFVGSTAAIALVGATPVFVDVDWDYNLNPALIEKALTKRTKAIMPVHLTGNPCKMDEINAIAKAFGLSVLEDAAQSVGGYYRNLPTGSLSNAGCFSLHPLKNLHVWGDGGVITTSDEALYENLKLQRNHGLRNRDEVDFFSYNSRLDTMQAIVGTAFMENLPEVVARRTRNAETYLKELAPLGDKLRLPTITTKSKPAWHVFQIWCADRGGLIQHLHTNGIETKIHYPKPIHFQKAARYLGYQAGDFPVTEKLSEGIVSLPVRENLTSDEVARICHTVRDYFSTREGRG